MCRINKLGYTTLEDCSDPLYLWVITSQHKKPPTIEEDNDPRQRQAVELQQVDLGETSCQEDHESPFTRLSSVAQSIVQARSIESAIRSAQCLSRSVHDQDQGQYFPLDEENNFNDDQGQVDGQDEDQNDE